MKPCKHCACSKAKQKFVSKEATTEKSKKPCKRVYLDLSKITVPHADGTESKTNKKNWRIMVDEATGKKWSSFHDSKIGMVEPTSLQPPIPLSLTHKRQKNGSLI